jgi:adenylate cyclase
MEGFRALLFTDLESSTALTQSLGDAKAQEALRGHNAVVRTALAVHGGEEVKHTGDGIMAAFGSAVSAVEAALQMQRDLAGGEVRVRVGLNAGEPIAEEGATLAAPCSSPPACAIGRNRDRWW